MSYCESDRECAHYKQRLAEVERERDVWRKTCQEYVEKQAALQRENAHLQKQYAIQKEVADNQTWHVQRLERENAELKEEIRLVSEQRDMAVEEADAKERKLAAVRAALEVLLPIARVYYVMHGGSSQQKAIEQGEQVLAARQGEE